MSQVPAIAITGMSCRLAGASDLDSFWNSLISKRDPFSVVPNARFDPEVFATELPGGKARAVRGALVEDFELDWRSLRLPPAQVEHLHRVERLSLAVMGDALSDAGLRPRTGPLERGGIWFAANTIGPDPGLDPVARIRRLELVAPLREALDAQQLTRSAELGALVERVSDLAAPPLEPDVLMISACIIAGRASHIYDFRGGHLAVDSGMCSSLAAVSQAVRALQVGDCDVAMVCAAAPLITPSNVLAFAHRGELALDRPRPFAHDAEGTLLGDGAVAVVLERASDVASKRVYALVEGIGSAIAPSDSGNGALAKCVTEAAERALAQAGVTAEQVGQIESRAGGVAGTDRAEAAGLAAAYRRSNGTAPAVLTSSVPTVGFLQAASGLVALAKAALSIHRRCWPGQAAIDVGLEPVPGLRMPALADTWTGCRRAAVSDAGPSSIAYHAILADPRDDKAVARPLRRAIGREPIAIVGLGVIAPGSGDLEAFWRNTRNRTEVLGDLPPSRWDMDKLIGSSAELARAFRTRLASTVELPTLGQTPCQVVREVEASLDPATALALGAVEQALRDAGYTRDAWSADRVQLVMGQISLRTGETAAEKRVQYALLAALAAEVLREAGIEERQVAAIAADARMRFDRENPGFSHHTFDAFSGMSSAVRAAATFGFSGEVLSVDAACASSLVAVKIASNALQSGDADVVVAGGVSYHLLPEYYIGLGLMDALSTTAGRPFHRDADGFVPAEASGAVVLKRLSDARRAKDRIYAVISGHGVSSDGNGLSIYASNTRGQQLAMTRALDAAGWDASTVDLIEAHGPGAPLGDRAEMDSLAACYRKRPFLQPVAVASAKSLIGHSSSAGAMISLIRASLALASKVLPPSGGNGDLAPELPFGSSFELSRVTRPWVSTNEEPRRAAVNSFGMTGINHHVLLEEEETKPCRQDVPQSALAHPATRPGKPLKAERYVLVETPVSLPEREVLHHLQGRTLAVIADRGSFWRDMERALVARGARTVRLELAECACEADVRLALPNGLEELDGIVDLSSLGAEADLMALSPVALDARIRAYADRSFAVLRVLYERLALPHGVPSCYVAVTSVSQSSDPELAGTAAPVAAFFQGLARSLKQELPGLLCKAIDIDPLLSHSDAATSIVRELEDGNDRVDVRYCGGRFVTTLRRDNFRDTSPVQRRLNPGDVFVFSGGGRGVVYQCATALARLGINVVVTGRRPLPDAALPWVTMSDSEFSDFRRTELIRRRGSTGPAQIIKELDDLSLQRQVYDNIATAEAAGLSLHYEICDITNLESVTGLTKRVRSRFGRIDGVGHGAMIEHSATIPRKSQQTIEATLSTKVLGLLNLIHATREDSLAHVVAFGSGVGRYGNSGQTDYAAANAVMASLLRTYSQGILSKTHCVTIDWPAWESLGATANPDIAELLRTAGVTSISPDEGSYWFLSELALGKADEVVICGEQMLRSWPFLAQDADGKADRAIEVDDEGRALLQSRWPMLGRVIEKASDVMVIERQVSLEHDLYMSQHLLNGLAVLPATFGCEFLAEGAQLACPGFHVQEISQFHVDSPLSLPRGLPVNARVVTRVSAEVDSRRVVHCELRSPLAAKLGGAKEDRCHHVARLSLTRTRPASLGTLSLPKRSAVLHAASFYETIQDPVSLGRLFFNARWIQLFESEASGVIEPPELRSMFSEISEPHLVAHPLVLDSALQIAGSWDGYRNGYVSVPVAIESVLFGRAPGPTERTRAVARVIRVEHPIVSYDIFIVGEDSEVVAKLLNVQLKRIGNPSAS